MTSFNLNYLFKGPISKYSHIGDQGFNIRILGVLLGACWKRGGQRMWENTLGPIGTLTTQNDEGHPSHGEISA